MVPNPIRMLAHMFASMSSEMERSRRQFREVYNSDIEPTIDRLNDATRNLQEALSAVEELKVRGRYAAEETKSLVAEREVKQHAYDEAMAQLQATKELLEKDKKRLQRALGISPWRERGWGLAIGIVGSLLASKAYDSLKPYL